MAALIFIHGLNTFGDDNLHVGPLRLEKMQARLSRALSPLLSQRNIDFVAIENLGAGAPEEQAERVLKTLTQLGYVNELSAKTNLHLLGQSTGGLVARVLAQMPVLEGRVKSVITIGTPHHGTRAALFGLEFGRRFPFIAKLFSVCGYDTRKKIAAFERYTPQAMQSFNHRYPLRHRPGQLMGAMICEIAPNDISAPLQVFYKFLHPPTHPTAQAPASDGFVHSDSQKWGENFGTFALDHFGELGFFFQARAAARQRSGKEFQRLIASICSVLDSVSN